MNGAAAFRSLTLAAVLLPGLAVVPILAAEGPCRPKTGEGDEPAQSSSDPAELCNPVPYTEESIESGRKHYLRYCQTCHGFDGKALENIDFEAADLTDPEVWRYGATDGDLFVNTRDGAGDDMPPFGHRLKDEQLWELVNYLRSIGPEEKRPELVESSEGSSDDGRSDDPSDDLDGF